MYCTERTFGLFHYIVWCRGTNTCYLSLPPAASWNHWRDDEVTIKHAILTDDNVNNTCYYYKKFWRKPIIIFFSCDFSPDLVHLVTKQCFPVMIMSLIRDVKQHNLVLDCWQYWHLLKAFFCMFFSGVHTWMAYSLSMYIIIALLSSGRNEIKWRKKHSKHEMLCLFISEPMQTISG